MGKKFLSWEKNSHHLIFTISHKDEIELINN